MSSTNFLSFLFLFLCSAALTLVTAVNRTAVEALVQNSCVKAQFPDFCTNVFLERYKTIAKRELSQRQFSKLALAVSMKMLNRTQTLSALAKASTPISLETIGDLRNCDDSLDTTFDMLCDSWTVLKSLGSRNADQYNFNVSSLVTWMSSGLTNIGDCKDMLAEKGWPRELTVEYVMFVKKVNVTSMVISSALAVFNTLQN